MTNKNLKMSSGDAQQFSLRWNDFQTNMVASFKNLRTDHRHKMILCACSPYLKNLLEQNPAKHPINHVPFHHLTAILEFMYAGEVKVAQDQLPQFLKTAERLKVKGLADAPGDEQSQDGDGK